MKTNKLLQLRIPHRNTSVINFLKLKMTIVMSMFLQKKLKFPRWQELPQNKQNPLLRSQRKRNQNIMPGEIKEISLMTLTTTTISQRKKRRSTSQRQLQLLKKARESTKSKTRQAPPAMTRSITPIMTTSHIKNFLLSNKSSLTEPPQSSLALTQKLF